MTGLVNRHTNSSLQLKASSIFAEVNGFAARVLATLTYYNDCEYDVEGLFLFPQDERATVVEFEATIEERHVHTQVSETITQDYGKNAFALEEREDDVFSLSLGRIPALISVFVQVTLITELGTDESTGGSLFILPSVFTPRLANEEDENSDLYGSQILISNIPRKTQEPYSFELQLEVAAPCLLAGCSSRTHAIQVDADSRATNASRIHITIAEPHTYDRELEVVLHLSHPYDPYVLIEEGKKEFGALRLEDNSEEINKCDSLGDFHRKAAIMINYTPRLPSTSSVGEFIFLVDRSGSMSGDHIFHVKEALILFLKSLPTNCDFNVIGFGSYYRSLFQVSQVYSESTLEKACTYVNKMRADLGGTNLLLPLEFIFEKPTKRGVGRTVFMVTDGGVSNTLEVVDFVRRNSHTTRFYTFGLGPEACPNLVQGMAGAGRGKAYFIADDERIPDKVMEALTVALQPAITDLEISWHLPEGYDVIQTPLFLPFVQNNERLVIYGILYRPPGEEKDSPRTPSKRKMDWSMRSFSNSSVKVFWFEDECDLLSDDHCLLEVEEEQKLSDNDFESDSGMKDEQQIEFPKEDSFEAEMERLSDFSFNRHTIEVMADGLLRDTMKEMSENNDEPTGTSAVPEECRPQRAGDAEEISKHAEALSWNNRKNPGLGIQIPNKNGEMNNNTPCSGNFKPLQSPIKDDNTFELALGSFFRHHITGEGDSEPECDDHQPQMSRKLVHSRERDSGVGFSVEESDRDPDENNASGIPDETTEETDAWASCRRHPAFREFEDTKRAPVRLYKTSQYLAHLGVPDDFGAVSVRGFVGDEEMEQVIPFPVNRSGASSKRPTIHQLLGRSLIRELQASSGAQCTETVQMIKRISLLSRVSSRHTALVARDQYCYDDEVLSALQFPQKESGPYYGTRKVQVQERNSAFTAGLGRRLPSPEGSDQTSSTEFVEGDNALPETEEEPVDFYRLERTGTPESPNDDNGSRKEVISPSNSPTKGHRKQLPPLSTRCVLGERQQYYPRVKPKLLISTSLDACCGPGTREQLSFVRMINLQLAQGNWNLDNAFAKVLGLPLMGLQEASPLADNSVVVEEDLQDLMDSDKCDNSSQLWATALALTWLHSKWSEYEVEWSLPSKKAKEWLLGMPCPRGFSHVDLTTSAVQALLLLEWDRRKNRLGRLCNTPQGKVGGFEWWSV